MGMFDELKCEYPLPDPIVQDEIFQTKSLDRLLDNYTLTRDGRLILHQAHYGPEPEEEQPLISDVSEVPRANSEKDVEISYHGDVFFYTLLGTPGADDWQWFEYKARFIEGKLQWIQRAKPHEHLEHLSTRTPPDESQT